MKRSKLVFACFFILGSLCFFCYTVEKDTSISNKTLVNSKTISENDNYILPTDSSLYYMKFQNNQIVIYNQDHSVFEFTDLQKEYLPASLVYEIEEGKYFKDQQELYEFLETYTS